MGNLRGVYNENFNGYLDVMKSQEQNMKRAYKRQIYGKKGSEWMMIQHQIQKMKN